MPAAFEGLFAFLGAGPIVPVYENRIELLGGGHFLRVGINLNAILLAARSRSGRCRLQAAISSACSFSFSSGSTSHT